MSSLVTQHAYADGLAQKNTSEIHVPNIHSGESASDKMFVSIVEMLSSIPVEAFQSSVTKEELNAFARAYFEKQKQFGEQINLVS